MLRALRFADAVEQEARAKRQRRGDDAGQARIRSGPVEALVQRVRGGEAAERIRQGAARQRAEVAAGQGMPRDHEPLHAHDQHGPGQQRRPPGARQHAREHAHREAVEVDEQQPAELWQQHVPCDAGKQAVGRRHQQVQQHVQHDGRKAQRGVSGAAAQEVRAPRVGQRRLQHALPAAEQVPHEQQRRQEAEAAKEHDHELQIELRGQHVGGHELRQPARHRIRQIVLVDRRLLPREAGKPPVGQQGKRDEKDRHADKQAAPDEKTGGHEFIAAHIHDPPFPG